MKKIFITFLLFSAASFAQLDSLLTDEIIDTYAPETETGEITESSEDVLSLIENPVDINKAGEQDLSKLPFLDNFQIKQLITVRDSLNRFDNFKQIAAAIDISSRDLQMLKSFIVIRHRKASGKKQDIENVSINLRNRITGEFYPSESSEFGNINKTYHRLKLNYSNNISINSLVEKDAGERNYTDFASYSIGLNDLPANTQFVFGDYIIQFGQGLSVWSAYSSLKSSEATLGISKNSRNLRTYTSTDEFRFFRGIAASVHSGMFDLSLYYSSKRIDATLDDNDLITSFRKSGYHLSENDEIYRDNVKENFAGLNAGISPFQNFRLSYFLGITKFDREFSTSSRYAFISNKYNIHSLGYIYYHNKLKFSGETSASKNGIASINNLSLNTRKNVNIIFSYRFCDENYFSFYSNSFGESSSLFKMEKGFYTGFKFNTGYGIINSFYDFYSIKRKYDDIFPFNGNEFMVSYRVYPIRKFLLKAVYKHKTKELTGLNDILIDKSDKFRFDITYSASNNLRLKSRYENRFISPFKEKGELFYQDLRYSVKNKLTLNLRFTIFKTDSYSSAIYQFENDLPGMFYNPPLYGEGIKWYINSKYKIWDLTFGFKYSEHIQLGATEPVQNENELFRTKCRVGFQIEYSSAF